MGTNNNGNLRVGIAQIAPCWLRRDATEAKIITWLEDAAGENCDLVVFGEALLPGGRIRRRLVVVVPPVA